MIKEIFKPLNELPGYEMFEGYSIGNLGNVLSFKRNKEQGTIMKSFTDSHHYHQLVFSCKGKQKQVLLHRLVALAFVPNPENKPQVNHIDENIANNEASNLCWMTAKENSNYGSRNKRMSEKLFNGPCAKPIYAIHIETGERIDFLSQADAQRKGFQQGNITKCLYGLRKTHKGYRWYKA